MNIKVLSFTDSIDNTKSPIVAISDFKPVNTIREVIREKVFSTFGIDKGYYDSEAVAKLELEIEKLSKGENVKWLEYDIFFEDVPLI